MALHRKREPLLGLDGDVVVIQECSKPSIDELNALPGFSAVWCGGNIHKGLGVLVRKPWRIRKVLVTNLTWIMNVELDGPVAFNLYAVWACRGDSHDNRYIGQVHRLLDILDVADIEQPTAVIGDFNSNRIWDSHSKRNHSEAVSRFQDIGIMSAYHAFTGEAQGAETRPTLNLQRNRNKPYHIDYLFLPEAFISALSDVRVGDVDDWIGLSDHCPIFADVGI